VIRRGKGIPPRGGVPRHGGPSSAWAGRADCGTHTIRTDTEALTKKKLEYNAKNLNDFDAVVFYTGGTLEMTPEQNPTFCRLSTSDGKGFVGIHSATITFHWLARIRRR